MQFGTVSLDQAEGAILAHATGTLRKGTVLDAGLIAQLRAEGVATVIAARLGPDDLAEDAAASAIAQGLVPDPHGQGLRIGAAATGRVNLMAMGPGVLRVNREAVEALNAVHPMITLATLPAWKRVIEGAMVATIKIIAYGVPTGDVRRAAEAGKAALSLIRPAYATATLIETTTDGTTPSPKGREAMRSRLARLGLSLSERLVVRHDAAAIAQALRQAPGQVLMILTASATCDPADVGPEGLRQAGGTVTRFGMPVDPGNLLFLGDLGQKPVVGLPGCARSPALNGADWVLERVICGVPVSAADIAAMGVGGLLKEIPSRPRLRAET